MGGSCASPCICDQSTNITPHAYESEHETHYTTSDETDAEERTKIVCMLDNPIGSAVDDLRIFEIQGVLYTKDVIAQIFLGIPKARDGFIRLLASQEPPKHTTYTEKWGDRC